LIGDKFVDINSGSSAGHIQPGAELTYKEQTEIFKTLDLTDFKKRLSAMDDLLSDLEAGRGAIGKAVQSDQFYNDLRNRIGGLQQAIHDVASTTGQVGQAVYTDKLYQRLSEPFVQMDQTLAQIQSGQGTAGQLVRDTGAYESARQSARDLQKAVADLRASDFMTSDALYNEWNRSLTQFIQTVDRMSADPMLSSTHVYETLTGTALELRNTVKDFRENPRKFLRLKVF
jgi:phospholipid/cholesterol/gamma-HCH transport system substrate-binding protein